MKIKTITPGIRLPGDKSNDQKRITSPKNAFTKQKEQIGDKTNFASNFVPVS